MEEAGHFMWLVWKHIWLSMVGPKLEVEAINRGTSHHWPSSGCSELTAAEAVAWRPGWLLQRCGSEVYCHLWCIHCPQVHQVPQFPLLAILLLDRSWPIRDTGDPGLRYSRIVQLSHRKLYHEIFWVFVPSDEIAVVQRHWAKQCSFEGDVEPVPPCLSHWSAYRRK